MKIGLISRKLWPKTWKVIISGGPILGGRLLQGVGAGLGNPVLGHFCPILHHFFAYFWSF